MNQVQNAENRSQETEEDGEADTDHGRATTVLLGLCLRVVVRRREVILRRAPRARVATRFDQLLGTNLVLAFIVLAHLSRFGQMNMFFRGSVETDRERERERDER